jgi:hypothetical protein
VLYADEERIVKDGIDVFLYTIDASMLEQFEELGTRLSRQAKHMVRDDCLDLSIIQHGPPASWTCSLNDAQWCRARFTS